MRLDEPSDTRRDGLPVEQAEVGAGRGGRVGLDERAPRADELKSSRRKALAELLGRPLLTAPTLDNAQLPVDVAVSFGMRRGRGSPALSLP